MVFGYDVLCLVAFYDWCWGSTYLPRYLLLTYLVFVGQESERAEQQAHNAQLVVANDLSRRRVALPTLSTQIRATTATNMRQQRATDMLTIDINYCVQIDLWSSSGRRLGVSSTIKSTFHCS